VLLGRLRLSQKRARTRQADAQQRLNRVAAGAYRDGSYGIVQLLSSPSISVLSDRLEMLDLMARIQVDSATTAQVAGVQARELGEDLKSAEARQRVVLRTLGKQKGTIKERIADQRALIASLEEELRRPIVVKAPPPQRRTGPAPKINGEGAAAAISAARSAIGVRYTYAGDNPDQGFDCSGLTMWAWRYGGVSLPHSSQAQYDAYPHVARSELQPGDLLFFYEPISHVGLYVGGGQMIHASSSNDAVVQADVYWQYFTGAARVT
jgi:cell wall-associated NlpC family hydrolase